MNKILNLFKKHWFVTLTEKDRGPKTYKEQKFVIRAWTGWQAYNIAWDEASKLEGEWCVQDMKRI